ncbi:pullulanase [Salipaludibacillus sp. HK11]|uniref:pullulanase n=1 Tax=Salipaludibacillus sp. HK11 TaxID=3394320 RepID=UPI0039FD41A6
MKRKMKRYSAIFMVFVMLMSLLPTFIIAQPVQAEEEIDVNAIENNMDEIQDNHLRVHFENRDRNVADLALWLWGDVATLSEEEGDWPDGKSFIENQSTDYGPYLDIELNESAELIGLNVLYENDNLLEGLEIELITEAMNEVWISEQGDIFVYEPVDLPDDHIRIHYYSEEESYEPWGVWAWGEVSASFENWPEDAQSFSNEQIGKYGAYIDLELNENASGIGFLLVNRENGDEQTEDMSFNDVENHNQIFIREGDLDVYTNPYYFSEEEEEVEYKDGENDISVSGEVSSSLNYNESAILSVVIENDDNVGIEEIYADLSELGGRNETKILTDTNRLSISVRHDIEPGEKNIPITVIDEENGTYTGNGTVVVEPRPAKNGDFDWDEAMIYFMLTDRFYDGDSSNNDPYGIGYDDFDNDRGTYQGGDFVGITKKLDYLDDLGINTIWINPIVENVGHDVEFASESGAYFGYHGYWASNFEELNPHLGSMEDFHNLIDAAADRDMKIMVDVVLNHPGYGVKEEDALPENERPDGYPTDGDRERFAGMIREESGSNDLTMELAGLPDFLTEEADVREAIIDWQTSWIERSTTANGNSIDFFRVDTVKHVDDTTWQQFKNELTMEMSEFKMIGESWGAGPNNDHGYLDSGMMDSLLDFDFKNSARRFAQGNLESVNEDLKERNAGIDNKATLGQFLGSHDESGFLSHQVDGNEGMLKVAAALQITAKGQPVIYYGEELGQSGADNWPQYDNRYDLDWDNVEGNDILEHYQAILSFRGDNSEVFARGERNQIAGSDDEEFLLFDRAYNGDSVYVGLNVSEEEQYVTLNVDSEDVEVMNHYNGEAFATNSDNEVTIPIPAMADGGTVLLTAVGGEILTANAGDGDDVNEAPTPPGIPDNTLRVHYENEQNDFSGLGLWFWEDVVTASEDNGAWPDGSTLFSEGGTTSYGAYVDIDLIENAERVSLLVNNRPAGENLTGDINLRLFSAKMNEIWLSESGDVSLIEPVELPENTVRLHYERDDKAYEPWRVWTWGDVLEATTDWPTGAHPFSNDQTGKHGAYIDLDLAEDADEIGFLLLNPDSGDQTEDMTFSGLREYNHIFIREGDETVYTNPYYVFEEGLESGEMLSEELIELRFTSTEDFSNEDLEEGLEIVDKDGIDVDFDSVSKNDDGKTVNINGSFDLDEVPYEVTYMDKTVVVSIGWRYKDEKYAYEGDLGVDLHEDGSATLKVWSPSADNVSIVLYDADDQYEVIAEGVEMTRGDRGVWQVTLDEDNTSVTDLNGYYYHFEIERGGESVLALDPYAKSMATWNSDDTDNVPIGKAAIVDLSAIGPELDFADIDGFEKREDAIIYEIHVRDFTSDPDIDEELEAQFGTFASFIEKLDYIEDLGVTHVQMLPVMSYFFADEFNNDERLLEYDSTQNNYNWGYDPHSYFSLTGMYSEDPDDAEKRIEEFKMLIDEIHDRGMGVILDVVYNHTARVEIFEDLEPEYYHFMNADGTSRTSFGGGRLGTTHEMSRRILVDSIMHWVEEYKVDGFRFDMMGDHDAKSIQIAYDKAKAANPDIVMIGEGWETFAGDENGGDVMPADQQWMQHTESVGSFSDEFRNELKSGFGSEGQPRFLTGGARNIQQIFDNVTANPHNFTATNPGDVVPYIAAHDNLTLHDVIAQSIKKDPEHHQEEIHQRIRLGNLMVLTSQGTAFIHAGQEFGRTKQFRAETDEAPYKSTYMEDENGEPFEYPYFIHDSYDSTDAINMIEWDKATEAEAYPINNQTREYTTGLIELRRSSDAFRLGTMEEIADKVTLIDAPEIADEDLIIGYKTVSSDDLEEYYVFVNTDNQERTLTMNGIDLTKGTVLVDSNESGIVEVTDPSGFELTEEQITIDALTAVVVKKDVRFEKELDLEDIEEGEEVSEKLPGLNNVIRFNGKTLIETNASISFAIVDKDVGKEMKVHFPSSIFKNATGEVTFTATCSDPRGIEGDKKAYSNSYNLTLRGDGIDSKDFGENPVKLEIPVKNVPEEIDVNKLAIHYFNEDTDSWDYIGGSFKDGVIIGETPHFSEFAVLEDVRLDEAMDEILDLQEQILDLNDRIQELENDNSVEELKKLFAELEKEISDLVNKYQDLANVNVELEKLLNDLRAELDYAFAEADEKAQMLQEQLNDLLEMIQDLNNDSNLEDLEKKLAELEAKYSELKSDSDLEKMLNDLKVELEKLKESQLETPGTDEGDSEGDADSADDGSKSGDVSANGENERSESESDQERKDGETLPETATNTFNLLFIGVLLLLVGGTIGGVVYYKKRNSVTE